MLGIIVCRVSSVDQQQEGYSLEAQKARLIEYAKRKNIEIIKIYEIVESSTRGKRKEFMKIIEFCKSQPETIALIFETVDRAIRNFRFGLILDELVQMNKIILHFNRDGLIISKESSSTDVLRWNFSIMFAKAVVLKFIHQ